MVGGMVGNHLVFIKTNRTLIALILMIFSEAKSLFIFHISDVKLLH